MAWSRTSQPWQYGQCSTSRPHRSRSPGTSGSSSARPVVTSRRRARTRLPSARVTANPSPSRSRRRHLAGLDPAAVAAHLRAARREQLAGRRALAAQVVVHAAAGALRGSPASTTSTERRDRASISAPLSPAAPPPITTTSYLSSMPSARCSTTVGIVWQTSLPVWQTDGMDDLDERSRRRAPGCARCANGRRPRWPSSPTADRHLGEHAVAAGVRRAAGRPWSCCSRWPGRTSVTLDELVDAPPTGDPRVHLRPVQRGGMTMLPLTRRPGGVQAYKLIIPPGGRPPEPDPKTHEGYEWLYVLDGRLRLRPRRARPGADAGRGGRVRHPHPALVRAGGRARRRVPQPVRPAGRARPPARPARGWLVPR